MSDQQLFPDGHWQPPKVDLIVGQCLLASIASAAVGLRLYERVSMRRWLTLDDICFSIGLCLVIARTVVTSLSSQSGWASAKGPEASYQVPYYLHNFERRLLYALAGFFIRVGVLSYYLRLFPAALTRLRMCSWILLGLSVAQGAQMSVVLGVSCSQIIKLYRYDLEGYSDSRCSKLYAFTISAAAGDAVIDAIIYILPFPYVWGLKRLRLQKRIELLLTFGVGIVACIFAVLQIPFLVMNYRKNTSTNQSWFSANGSTFIMIELCFGLVAASLHDVRRLFARMIHNVPPTTESSSGPSPVQANAAQLGLEAQNDGRGRTNFKKPYWLHSTFRGSLWEQTQLEDDEVSRERSRSRSRSAGMRGESGMHAIEQIPTIVA